MSPDLGDAEVDGERVFAPTAKEAAERWVSRVVEWDGRALRAGQSVCVRVWKRGESRSDWFAVRYEQTTTYTAQAVDGPAAAVPRRPPYLRVVR